MRWIPLFLLVELLSGCAYLTTYKRSIDLNGKSVTMDVKQRVIFGQKRFDDANPKDPTKNWNVICAEPSPDALTVLGATGALSATNAQSGTAANATAALAESGASIGLRTQSIQLLRDAMYRLCEGYASGAISASDYTTMQRRFQNTMMGLIAIEQLTGPVVAGQALLNASASSQAGVGAADAAVTKAQADVKTTTDASLTTQANLDTANSNYDKAHKDLLDNQREIAAENAKEHPDAERLHTLKDATPSLQDAQTKAADSRKDAERRAQVAAKDVSDAKTALAAAQSRASSSAAGSGTLSSIAATSAQMQQNLGQTVSLIVTSINSAYERDDCLALMSNLVNDPERLMRLQKAVPVSTLSNDEVPKTTLTAATKDAIPTNSPPPQVDPVSVIKTALGTCSQILERAEREAEVRNRALEAEAMKFK